MAKHIPLITIAAHRARTYGLTPEDSEAIMEKQGFRCAICRRDFGESLRECVDHDHVTGKVRGILCFRCNTGMGAFEDDPRLLSAAADFLYRNS